MAEKRTKEEIREEILKGDDVKDVNLYAAVTIAVIAGISSAAGIIAVLSIGFLESFRKDVDAFWLACIPFCFPFITGVATAYRKQLANIGIHIALLLAALLSGGAGYGYSIQPVYIERENCTIVTESRGDCHKESLVFLYVIAGGVAAGFAFLGLVVSFCTCSNATKRRAKRESERQRRLEQEIDKKNKEVKHIKQSQAKLASPMFTNHTETPAKAKTQPAEPPKSQITNGTKSADTSNLDATTHL